MTARSTISPTLWEKVSSCFDEALDLPEDERAPFVLGRLPGDTAAQREVLEMLASASGDRALSIERRVLSTADSDAPVETLANGLRIGAYRILDLVGRGGMGEVYRAERVDGAYEQHVAVKVLRAGLDSRELVRRFERERRILARLAHPNIVAILDGGTTTDGRPYLVMPYVDGLTIFAHCDAEQLSLDDRLRLFQQVAAAVQYAHSQLIVHRDIKPSNILVTRTGAVRLLDFGIAKLLDDGLSADTDGMPSRPTADETRSQLRLLTPEHAAPEQVRGEPVTAATDVYALGVLLYQLLTGTRPHIAAGRSLRDLEREITDVEAQAPSLAGWNQPWKRQLKGDLDRIVLMALRKEPARRYASAGQFADDVERYLKRLPVQAEADSLGYRTSKFLRRNRVAVAAGATVAALLLAFAVTSARQAQLVARERDVARREKASTENVVALLTSFFAQANPTVVPGGDTLRVNQLLTYAEARVDSLRNEPQVQARMWRVLGTMYAARGRPDRALSLLQRAYDQLMRTSGSDSMDVALTYHELARAVDGYEGRPRSMPMFEASVARFARLLSDTARDRQIAERDLAIRRTDESKQRALVERLASANSLATVTDTIQRAERVHALAEQRLAAGAVTEAIALFTEALRLVDLKLPANHPDRILVAGNVAAARRTGGEFDVAEILTRQRLASQRAQQPVNPLALAAALEMLAVIQAERGYLEEAESLQREAMRGWRASLAPSHQSIRIALTNLAYIASARGRDAEAVAYADTGVMLTRAAKAEERDLVAYLDTYGDILLRAGRSRDAAATFGAITARIEALWPAGHQQRNTHALHLGTLALALGDPRTALVQFASARDLMAPLVPVTYPLLVNAECGRGVALARLGRMDEARPLLTASCARYRQYGIHFAPLVQWASEALAKRQ